MRRGRVVALGKAVVRERLGLVEAFLVGDFLDVRSLQCRPTAKTVGAAGEESGAGAIKIKAAIGLRFMNFSPCDEDGSEFDGYRIDSIVSV